MSGFEVARVLLGVFPIVLEAYRPLRDHCKNWSQFRNKFGLFVIDLSEQGMHFQANIVRLLQKCFPNGEVSYEQVSSDKAGAIWTQHATTIRRHLGTQRLRFLQHLMAMRTAVDQLQTMLGIDDEGNIGWLDDPDISSQYLRKRLLFCCSSKGDEILLALRENNLKLRNILGWSDSTLPFMQQREKNSTGGYHESVRRLCLASLASLQSAWQCSCPDDHRAEILVGLHQRESVSKNMRLQVKLSLSSSDSYPVTLSSPQPASMATSTRGQNGSDGYFRAARLQNMHDNASKARPLTQRAKSSMKPAKTSNHAQMNAATYAAAAVKPIPTKHPSFKLPAHARQAIQHSHITDLCATLRNTAVPSIKANVCYGLVSDQGNSHQFLLHAAPSPRIVQGRSIASVVEARDFNIKQRVLLAISLVSAVLQSHSTGWDASASWNKDDIRFHTDGPSIRIVLSSLLRPSISASSSLPPQKHRLLTEDETYELMSQLGVLLLEILYGRSIESLRTSKSQCALLDDVGVAKTAPDWNDVEGQVTEKVVRVIKCCLWTNFSGTWPDLLKQDFRRTIHDLIIARLQEFYELMWPEPRVP